MTPVPESPLRWPVITYIHEFPRPPVVAHFHPDSNDGGDFAPDHVQRALTAGVGAIEVDLRYRASDAAVACNHDRAKATSPTLNEVIDLIVEHQGRAETVHGDGKQFFLVLEPKESTTQLFEQMYAVLGRYAHLLSTAVGPGDGPRPVTIVLTGSFHKLCHGFLSGRYGSAPNRLFISEDVDYTGVVVDISPRRDALTYQWTVLRRGRREVPRGRINALHLGADPHLPGRFNVRVWDTKTDDDLRLAVAAGADSVNCNLSKVKRLPELLRHQDARGVDPQIAIRGDRVLLVWQGRRGDGVLYAVTGTVEATQLRFARQVSFTHLLESIPLGGEPACLLTHDSRLLVVYEDARSGRRPALGYIAGRFVDGVRFVTFDGQQRQLTHPRTSVFAGRLPDAALAPDGRIVIVYGAVDGQIAYFSGWLSPAGELIGADYALGADVPCYGAAPTVAIAPTGAVLVVFEAVQSDELVYITGDIDDRGQFVPNAGVRRLDDAIGRAPSAAVAHDGTVVVAYEGTKSAELRYLVGRFAGRLEIQGHHVLTEGKARRGTSPSVGVSASGAIVVAYRGTGDEKIWYVHGTIDGSGRIDGVEHLLDVGLP